MKEKTFKREFAVSICIGLGFVVYSGDIEMVKALIWPVTMFTLGAFGMDSYAKQINPRASSS